MNIAKQSFTNIDEFLQQMRGMGWQGDISQTKPGAFWLDLSVVQTAGVIGTRTHHNVANMREIATPVNARTFGVVVPKKYGNSWCHRSFDEVVLQMMPRSDYTASNPAGHLGYQLAFDDDLVAEIFAQHEVSNPLVDDACILELTDSRSKRVLQLLETLFVADCDLAQVQTADELLTTFVDSFSSGCFAAASSRAGARRAALNRAREYMHANIDEAITLADVSRYVNASRRTLTQAFQETLALAPMTYLKLLRLNRVHQTLQRQTVQPTKIVDVANDHGFWHMGQFARDYRQLFGELPSQTLADASV
jgi:AraC-like DNA-binding protein